MPDDNTSSREAKSRPLIPNSYQTPNVLADELMKVMDAHAWKVVSAITRFTYGWGKRRDTISLTQLMSLTGLSRPTVVRSIKTLRAAGLLNVTSAYVAISGRRRRCNEYELLTNLTDDELVNAVNQLKGRTSSCETASTGKRREPSKPNCPNPMNGAAKNAAPVGRPASANGRRASTVDHRHHQAQEAIKEIYAEVLSVPCPWGAAEAGQLARFLRENPNMTLQQIVLCVRNRFASDGARGDPPKRWIGSLTKYLEGPLDRYGQPKGNEFKRIIETSQRAAELAFGDELEFDISEMGYAPAAGGAQ